MFGPYTSFCPEAKDFLLRGMEVRNLRVSFFGGIVMHGFLLLLDDLSRK